MQIHKVDITYNTTKEYRSIAIKCIQHKNSNVRNKTNVSAEGQMGNRLQIHKNLGAPVILDGTGYTILGAANSVTHTEFQQITIPAGCTKNLTFWLNVTSNETTTTTQFDRFFVEVRNTSGTLLATLATFSNLNKGTAGVYVQRGPFSLASFAGQTVRIQFRATTDSSLTTTFRVDDVSVQ